MERPRSLLENGIFNIIKTFSSLVFPLITFAYASRTLGDVGIGQVNFVRSFVSYFTMLAMLGMNYYGTREAAKLREDESALSQFVQEMLMINGCTSFISCALAIVCFVAIPRIHGYGLLFFVCAAVVPLQCLGVEWLYQALERYRYIAIRSIAFQGVALVMLFIFVRGPEDVVAYAAVSLFSSSGIFVLNFINARKYIFRSASRQYSIRKHLKPLLWLFALMVSIELYTVLDTTMLGFIQGDAAVGRYTAAVKVHRIVNSIIASIGVVLIPRLSYYIGKNQETKVRELVKQAYNYTFLLSIPAAVGLFMLSEEVILLLSGSEFASAGTAMRIMTPIIILIPFSMATNQQIFVPMKREKLVLTSTLVGAATNFTLNMILIPRYAENGAAIGTVAAEAAVAVVCLVNASRYFDMRVIFKYYHQYWLAAACVLVMCLVLGRCGNDSIILTGAKVSLSVVAYFGCLFLLKNPYFRMAIDAMMAKLRRRS